jgi:hypothetical protein
MFVFFFSLTTALVRISILFSLIKASLAFLVHLIIIKVPKGICIVITPKTLINTIIQTNNQVGFL